METKQFIEAFKLLIKLDSLNLIQEEDSLTILGQVVRRPGSVDTSANHNLIVRNLHDKIVNGTENV